MNTQRMLLAAAALALGGGAMGAGTARAEAVHTTLYTPIVRAGHFACNAVNVSGKPLAITISILNDQGVVLAGSGPIGTPNGYEAAIDTGTEDVAMDAYCVFAVTGSSDRDDLRAVLNTTFNRPLDEDPNIRVLLARTVTAQ
jgi:hypothetical protein